VSIDEHWWIFGMRAFYLWQLLSVAKRPKRSIAPPFGWSARTHMEFVCVEDKAGHGASFVSPNTLPAWNRSKCFTLSTWTFDPYNPTIYLTIVCEDCWCRYYSYEQYVTENMSGMTSDTVIACPVWENIDLWAEPSQASESRARRGPDYWSRLGPHLLRAALNSRRATQSSVSL
jgi:hypothetical protein